jgi:hypothetical protein
MYSSGPGPGPGYIPPEIQQQYAVWQAQQAAANAAQLAQQQQQHHVMNVAAPAPMPPPAQIHQPQPQATAEQMARVNSMVRQTLPPNSNMSTGPYSVAVVTMDALTSLVTQNGNELALQYGYGTILIAPGCQTGIRISGHDIEYVHIINTPSEHLPLGPYKGPELQFSVLPQLRFPDSAMNALPSRPSTARTVRFDTPYATPNRAAEYDILDAIDTNAGGSAITSPSDAFAREVEYQRNRAETAERQRNEAAAQAINAEMALAAANQRAREAAQAATANTVPTSGAANATAPTQATAGPGSTTRPTYAQAASGSAGEQNAATAAAMQLLYALGQIAPSHVRDMLAPLLPPGISMPSTVGQAQAQPSTQQAAMGAVQTNAPHEHAQAAGTADARHAHAPAHGWRDTQSPRLEWRVMSTIPKFLHKPGTKTYSTTQFKQWLNVSLSLGIKHFFNMSATDPDSSLPNGWAQYISGLIDPQFFQTHILPVSGTITMADFKAMALKAYAPSIRSESDIARQEVTSNVVTQGSGSVAAYTAAYTQRMLLIDDMAEADRILFYKRGLKAEIRAECLANYKVQPPRDFHSLTELQQYAAWVELDHNDRAAERERTARTAPMHGRHNHNHRSRNYTPVVAPIKGGGAPKRTAGFNPQGDRPSKRSVKDAAKKGHPCKMFPKIHPQDKHWHFAHFFDEPGKKPNDFGRLGSTLFVCKKKQRCVKCLGPWHEDMSSCQKAPEPADHYMPEFIELTGCQVKGPTKSNGGGSNGDGPSGSGMVA